MAWQAFTPTTYRAVLTGLVAMATSKHVSAVAINAAGTGYVAGDVLTVTHAGAYHNATVEVLTVGGSGEVTSVVVRNGGAFSNRIASAAVDAGGTGYVVGDVLELDTGTATERGKVQVATLSGSAVATVTVFETGGAYSVAPSAAGATTAVGPAAAAGTGCTLTASMTGLIGTTGAATTGGTGSGCTLDLTLTDTGWTALRNRNSYTFNSVTNEKEVIMQGTVVGGDAPIVGFRSYTATVGIDTRYGILLAGFTGYNAGTAFDGQAGVGPGTGAPNSSSGAHVPLLNASQPTWCSVNGRRIVFVVKTVGASITAYQSAYVGLLDPFGTANENPYPLFVGGSSAAHNTAPDVGSNEVTGLTEAVSPAGRSGPLWFRRLTDTSWVEVRNSENGSEQQDHVIYPVGESRSHSTTNSQFAIVGDGRWKWTNGIALNTGATATRLFKPTPDSGGDLFLLVPATLIRTPDSTNLANDDVHGQLSAVWWMSGTKTDGTKVNPEDTIAEGNTRYTIFACAHRREQYSFFALQEV